MSMDAERSGDVLVLRPGRLWSLLLAIVFTVFVLGLWAIRHEANWAAVWVGILFFGFGAVVCAVRLIPGASYLRLDPNGFTFCAMFYRQTVAWADVSEFGVVPRDAVHAYATVGFNHAAGYAKNLAGRELAKSVNGWEGALPGTYGMRADDLADRMNEWRQRYGKPSSLA